MKNDAWKTHDFPFEMVPFRGPVNFRGGGGVIIISYHSQSFLVSQKRTPFEFSIHTKINLAFNTTAVFLLTGHSWHLEKSQGFKASDYTDD